MKIWIVGINSGENYTIHYACATKQLALKRLFEERDKLVKIYEHIIASCHICDRENLWKQKEILFDNDYKKWEYNYPNKIPYILEMELEEEVNDEKNNGI